MDFNVRVFKDAAAGFEKLVGALGKFGNLLIGATHTGVAAIDYVTATRMINNLVDLNADLARLSQRQLRITRPRLQHWLKRPDPGMWFMILRVVADMRSMLDDVSRRLKKAESALATQPFFPDLVGSIMVREKLINEILETPPPKTQKEKDAALDFVIAYDKLIDELARLVVIVAEYTEHFRKKRAWRNKDIPNPPKYKEYDFELYRPPGLEIKKRRRAKKKD